MSTVCFHQDYAMMTNTELNAVSDLHQRLPEFEDMAHIALVLRVFYQVFTNII